MNYVPKKLCGTSGGDRCDKIAQCVDGADAGSRQCAYPKCVKQDPENPNDPPFWDCPEECVPSTSSGSQLPCCVGDFEEGGLKMPKGHSDPNLTTIESSATDAFVQRKYDVTKEGFDSGRKICMFDNWSLSWLAASGKRMYSRNNKMKVPPIKLKYVKTVDYASEEAEGLVRDSPYAYTPNAKNTDVCIWDVPAVSSTSAVELASAESDFASGQPDGWQEGNTPKQAHGIIAV